MKYFARDSKGYTIIEIVVVVAILGGIMAVAVPSYLTSEARSRQTQAKLALSRLYAAEITFATVHGSFTTCLPNIGVLPSEGGMVFAGVHYYAFGFTAAAAAANLCGGGADACNNFIFPNATATPPVAAQACAAGGMVTGAEPLGTFENQYAANAVMNGALGLPQDADFPATPISSTSFAAAAIGSINSAVGVFDTWTIDQDKLLRNPVPGF